MIKLTKKELDRKESGAFGDFTIISRPNANGWTVAAVLIETSEIMYQKRFKPCLSYTVADAVTDVMRWIDKLGRDGEMASKSRERN